MASVLFFTSVGTGSLAVNQTASYFWNVPNDRIILWDVVPFLINPNAPGNWAKLQITSGWRFITQDPHKQQSWMQFKNVGPNPCDYEVLMAQVGA